MSGTELLAILLVVLVCGALLAGYPAALTLGGASFLVALTADAFGLFPLPLLNALPSRIYGVIVNETLMAIPLFIFMGVMLERSRVAEDLLEALARLLGNWRGGLGIAVLFVGLLLAAAKGVVGATTVTMGLIVLPVMLRHGYDPRLAAGTVAATSTLAQVFPPATVLVLLGFVMDAFEIIIVIVPIVAPPLLAMPSIDPVWLGVLLAVNLQTSYMHPPLGPTVFYLRSVAPPELTTRHIYLGVIPFICIQLLALVALWFAPQLATALPQALYGPR
jgi:TRAP-type mannitol/chloroaromatic compound transport system permease large subunit